MISRTIFWSAQAAVILAARVGPNPLDLAQTAGAGFDDVEHVRGEQSDHALGKDRADAPDHAGAEIFFDAFDR